jgi:Ca2+-binding RTX toxin-like protein
MPTNLIFIDPRVWNWRSLVAELPADSTWHLLDEHLDGVAQMQAFLAGYRDLASIQIISHGSAGAFYIGSSAVNAASLSSYSNQWAAIGSALSETGDLLLYGCDVAAGGEGGDALIRQLAALTGADVAASIDKTGAAALGGNWMLEAQTGSIEAVTLNSVAFQSTLANGFLPSDITDPANQFVFGGNLYQLVRSAVSFDVALSSAATLTQRGIAGHLVTITSLEEDLALWDAFVGPNYGNESANPWIAASDVAVEGVWRWRAGPEAGTVATFTKWASWEPNNSGNEDYAVLHWQRERGGWFDYRGTHSQWYIIEYEGTEIVAPVSLSVEAADAVRAEGNSGTTAFTFTVTRSGDTTGASSANWAVTGNGSRPANASDFSGGVLPSGTVSFAAGETSKTIAVNVAGDTTYEPDEEFTVTLSDPSTGAVIGTASASGIIRNDDAEVTLTDAAIAASVLNALDAQTIGLIDASSVMALTGTATAVAASYASSGIIGLGSASVTLSGTTVAASDLNAIYSAANVLIDASTVTTVTGAASAVATAYASSGIYGFGNEGVILSGTVVTAIDLNAVNAATTGTVNMASILTVTGSLSELMITYTAAGFFGKGNEALTLSDSAVVATSLSSLDRKTTGVIDASSVTTVTGTAAAAATAFASSGVSGLGNASVTLSDTTAAVSNVNAIDVATSGLVNASTVTTLTGTASAVASAYASSGINGLGNEAVILSGATVATAIDLNGVNAATTGAVNMTSVLTVTGALSDLTTTYTTAGFTGRGNEALTLSDTTVAASSLTALDLLTTGVIDASSVITVTGTLAAVATVYASSGISGLGNEALTLSDTTVAASALNALDLLTTGLIDASSVTKVTGTLAAVATVYASPGISGLGNEAITLSDTTVGATDLIALDFLTNGLIDASSVMTITGSLSEVATVYASSGISGLGNEAVALSNTIVAASDLTALDLLTSGLVDVSSVTTVTGIASAVAAAYASTGIGGLGNEAVTLSGTTAAASDLNTTDAGTIGLVDASMLTTLTGTASALATAYGSPGISGLGKEALKLSDTTVAAASLTALDLLTTGVIDASSVTTLTGTLSAVTAAYASVGISGLGNEAVTLSDTTATSTALNTLDTLRSGIIDCSTVTMLTGSLSEVGTIYASAGIGGLGTAAVTLSDTTATASELNAIDAGTSGMIDAWSVTTVTGTSTAVASSYASSGIIGLGSASVALSGTTATASELNAIDAGTSGVVFAATVTTVTGTASAVAAAYASSGISGLANEAVTLSGTVATALDLNAVNARTTGAVNMTSVLTVSGSLSDLTTTYTAAGFIGRGNEALKLLDSTVAATTLTALDLLTTGVIDASSVVTVTGTLAAVATAYASAGISGLGNAAVTLSDTTATSTALNALDLLTTGTIDASSVTTVTGTAATVAGSYTSSGISGLGSAAVTLSGTTAAAGDLNAIDAGTSGVVSAATVTTVTGTASAVAAAYASLGISGLANEAVTLSGTVATALDLNAVNARTTGAVNMTSVLTVSGSLSDLTTTYTAAGFIGRGNEAITLSDTTATATALNSLDGKTTGVIDASSVTTLSGTVSEVTTANGSAGISGLANAAFNVTGTAAADTINGGAHNDTLSGLGGGDFLSGGGGDDYLYGGDGYDGLSGGLGADALDGGAGSDYAYYSSSAIGLTVSLATPEINTGEATGDTFVSIENLYGSRFDDVLVGDSGLNQLTGGLGADVLNGGAGFDYADYYNNGSGLTVSLATPGVNTGQATGDTFISIQGLQGSVFDDILIGDGDTNNLRGSLGADVLDGGAGLDTAEYVNNATGLTVSLAMPEINTGEATGDTFISIEGLMGSSFADMLIGDGGSNFLNGRLGADVLDGGAGIDYAVYHTSTSGLTVSLATPAINTGEATGDTYISIEGLRGSNLNDSLTGDGGDNFLRGSLGADILDGGTGFDFAVYSSAFGATGGLTVSLATPEINTGEAIGDTFISMEGLIGSDFGDTLIGDTGDNVLKGDGGHDWLTGGNGFDKFVLENTLESHDIVIDFTHGIDALVVSADLFGGGLTAGALADGLFEAAADPLSLVSDSSGGRFLFDNEGSEVGQVYWDANGGAATDAVLIAILTEVTTLVASDFLLV